MKTQAKSALFPITATLLCMFAGHAAAQTIVPATKVALIGDIAPWNGATITGINTPFTDTDGKIGFTGTTTETGGTAKVFIFYDGGSVFTAEDALPDFTLTGRESTMGVGAGGKFVYSPSINGNDGIWSHAGYVVSDGDPAPGIPGKFIAFASRPIYLGENQFAFVGGTSDTPTSGTNGRVVYKGTFGPSGPPTLEVVHKTGDVVAGETLRFTTPGMSFNYDLSDNGEHVIHILGIESLSTRSVVLLNDGFIARPGELIPYSQYEEAYENFAGVGVNDAGRWIIFGDSSNLSETSSDGFLAFNGESILHENDTIDGIFLQTPASVRVASVNNNDQVGHIWAYTTPSGVIETLFIAEGADLSASRKIVSTGDQLDTNGDGIADYTVMDLTESTVVSPGMDLAEDGRIATQILVRAIGSTTNVEGVFAFCFENCGSVCPPCAADFDQDGGITGTDVEAFFIAFEAGADCADVDLDGGVTGSDVEAFFLVFEAGGC